MYFIDPTQEIINDGKNYIDITTPDIGECLDVDVNIRKKLQPDAVIKGHAILNGVPMVNYKVSFICDGEQDCVAVTDERGYYEIPSYPGLYGMFILEPIDKKRLMQEYMTLKYCQVVKGDNYFDIIDPYLIYDSDYSPKNVEKGNLHVIETTEGGVSVDYTYAPVLKEGQKFSDIGVYFYTDEECTFPLKNQDGSTVDTMAQLGATGRLGLNGQDLFYTVQDKGGQL